MVTVRAISQRTFNVKLATVQRHKPLHHDKPRPLPLVLAIVPVIALHKGLTNCGKEIFIDSNAGILDSQL